jgi:Kef-type K+ transport system membrane component KefB
MNKVFLVAGLVALWAAIVAGVWWLFYWLWNTIAAIFGAPELTFWQSVGLMVLVGLLTNGIRASKSSK